MSTPKVAGRKAIVMELEAGSYWWCSCGLSKNQPFCDGSHETTNFQPCEIALSAPKRCALCTCKMTKTAPFCDGSHKGLPPEEPAGP